MFSSEEKDEIISEIKKSPFTKSSCIDVIKIVQRHRGWISDDSIKDIAEILQMNPSEVDSIATFYTRIYRKPVGRNIILICDSISCMIMDYISIYNYISGKLGIKFGETTKDNRFTLLPVTCLGDCHFSPAMMINDDLYDSLTIEKIEDILIKYL